MEIIETPNNYDGKVALIKGILDDVKKRKNKHYSNYRINNLANTIFKSLINALNAVSVSSLILSYTEENNFYDKIALTSTSLSGVISAITSTINIEQKAHTHNTSYLQYTDIYRDVSARLLRNGMNGNDLDNLLSEINNRMGLIEDNSLPI